MSSSRKRQQSNTSDEVCKQQKVQHVIQHVTTDSPLDSLIPSLVGIREKCVVMNEQMDQLKDSNTALSRFNGSFGAFLFGMAANGAVVQCPDLPKMADKSGKSSSLRMMMNETFAMYTRASY